MSPPVTVLAMTGAKACGGVQSPYALPPDGNAPAVQAERRVLACDAKMIASILGIFGLGYGAGSRSLGWATAGAILFVGAVAWRD